MKKDTFCRKCMEGSITVEAAVIVPVILMMFVLLVTVLFYYHDKNVISAIAHETVVKASRGEAQAEELETFFRERLGGKLLLFSSVTPRATIEEERVQIVCTGKKKGMTVKVTMAMERREPEAFLRKWKAAGRIIDQLGGSE